MIPATVNTKLFLRSVCPLGLALLALPALAQDRDADLPLPHNPACTLESFIGRPDGIEEEVYRQLTQGRTLTVGVNYGNPNNAQLGPSGQLKGFAIDLGCILAATQR